MPSTARPPPEDSERPSKRTKVSTEEMDAEPVIQAANAEDEEEEEEEEEDTVQEPPEVRASDLYLDTASAFQQFSRLSTLIYLRLTALFLILTSRKCAQCPSPTSTFMAVWFVENISKAAGASRTRIPIPYTRTTMSLSISRQPRQRITHSLSVATHANYFSGLRTSRWIPSLGPVAGRYFLCPCAVLQSRIDSQLVVACSPRQAFI
jgi:hypothetical protein